MKKILIIMILFLTGCSASFLTTDFNSAINQVLKHNHRPNYVTKGYKLYLPGDVNVLNNYNNNLVLFTSGTKLYMYTDLISYYYKYQSDYEYDVNKDVYFSKKLDYDGILGYIEVRKGHGQYFIQVMYNYAKIEAVVSEENLQEIILKATVILKNIVYKQKIIGVMINNQTIGKNKEEMFKLFEPKNSQSEFLQYAETYDKYEGTYEVEENPAIIDPDQINIEEDPDAIE